MGKKSNHKHAYVRHFVFRSKGHIQDIYDVVNVCSVCGKVKELPMKERVIKEDSGYWRWPIYLEDLKKYFGDLPVYEP